MFLVQSLIVAFELIASKTPVVMMFFCLVWCVFAESDAMFRKRNKKGSVWWEIQTWWSLWTVPLNPHLAVKDSSVFMGRTSKTWCCPGPAPISDVTAGVLDLTDDGKHLLWHHWMGRGQRSNCSSCLSHVWKSSFIDIFSHSRGVALRMKCRLAGWSRLK